MPQGRQKQNLKGATIVGNLHFTEENIDGRSVTETWYLIGSMVFFLQYRAQINGTPLQHAREVRYRAYNCLNSAYVSKRCRMFLFKIHDYVG